MSRMSWTKYGKSIPMLLNDTAWYDIFMQQ